MRIFWPASAQAAGSDSGSVYGWVNGDLIVVVGVVCEAQDIVRHRLVSAQNVDKLVQQAGSLPTVIGTCSQSTLTLFGQDYDTSDTVLYYQPKRRLLHFLSLDSVNLHRAAESLDPIAAQLTPIHTRPATGHLARSVEQVNTSDEFAALLSGRRGRHEAIGNRILDRLYALTSRIQPVLVHWLENRFIPTVSSFSTVSATAAQLQLRTQQVVYALNEMQQAQRLNGLNSWGACGPYVAFWNCVWLFLNDAIFGYTLGTFVFYNRHFLARYITSTILPSADTFVANGLAWLDAWPAGLKLNTELSAFFHLVFLQISELFANGVQASARMGVFSVVLGVLGAVGCWSIALMLALCMDAVTILTLNISASYRIAAAIMRFQWSALYLLFTLFRGKRRNVLRQRIDSWEYDIDQLILGTVLFTLVVFLMPTVFVYYALFALIRLGLLFVFAFIEVGLACVNYFPLFALLLRIKDPARLPGGIYFEEVDKQTGQLILRNQPLAASAILAHFARYFSRMGKHYHPARLLWCFVSGRHLDRMSGAPQNLMT